MHWPRLERLKVALKYAFQLPSTVDRLGSAVAAAGR